MSRNPSALYIERPSGVDRKCENCGAAIKKGGDYIRASLPPWRDVNTSPKWWSLNLCLGCGALEEEDA